jgi:hypothetical protein
MAKKKGKEEKGFVKSDRLSPLYETNQKPEGERET